MVEENTSEVHEKHVSRASVLCVFLGISGTALVLLGFVSTFYVYRTCKRNRPKDTGSDIFYSSSSSESSGRSSEQSSWSIKRLVRNDHLNQAKQTLGEGGKRYLKKKADDKNGFTAFRNEADEISSMDDIADLKSFPITSESVVSHETGSMTPQHAIDLMTSHHNTAYYYGQ